MLGLDSEPVRPISSPKDLSDNESADDQDAADATDVDAEDDGSGNPRNHEWYKLEKAGDKYICPAEDCKWEGCKLKCDYQ